MVELQKCRNVIGIYHSGWGQAQIDSVFPTLRLSPDDVIGSLILMNYYFQDLKIISDLVVKVADQIKKSPNIKDKKDFYMAISIAAKLASLGMKAETDLAFAVVKFKEVMRISE